MKWFCCQCGDGPNNTTLVSTCTNTRCNHTRCSKCKVDNTDYTVYPLKSITYNKEPPHVQLLLFGCHAPRAHSTSTHPGPNLPGAHGPPANTVPKGPPNWRWICCGCRTANSVKVDVGCAGCNNHWYNPACCYTYDENATEDEAPIEA